MTAPALLTDPAIHVSYFFVLPHEFEKPDPTLLPDPAVRVGYFFALPYESEKPALTQVELEGLLTGVVGEVAGAPPAERVRLELLPARGSRRLAKVDPRPRADAEEELEIRTLHDAVYLRVSRFRRGQFPLGPAATLAAPHPAALEVEASNFLGKLTAHVAEADQGTSNEDLLHLAEELAEICLPGGEDERQSFSLPVGALVVGPLGESCRAVFVYRQGERVGVPFKITLHELFLSHLKVRNVERNLRAHYLREAKKQDYQLRHFIGATHPNELPLPELQKANDKLTTIRADLVTSICSIENELRTLEVARENFTRTLQGSPFEPEAKRLTDLLIDRWGVPLRNQALVDLGYRKATRERATVHFESLDATIDLHNVKQSNLLALVMAILTCAQAVGLVAVIGGNDFLGLSWWWRLLFMLGAFGLSSALTWLLIRRH